MEADTFLKAVEPLIRQGSEQGFLLNFQAVSRPVEDNKGAPGVVLQNAPGIKISTPGILPAGTDEGWPGEWRGELIHIK